MFEVEDERRRKQDADQAGDEREPASNVRERLETLLEVTELLCAGRAGIDGQARSEPVLVVRVGHLNAGWDEQGAKQGQDAEDDHGLGSLQTPTDPGHASTASAAPEKL